METYQLKEVTKEEAMQIIEDLAPIGSFYRKDGVIWVGIDNLGGNCWVEEFEDKETCFKWLRYEIEISDTYQEVFI